MSVCKKVLLLFFITLFWVSFSQESNVAFTNALPPTGNIETFRNYVLSQFNLDNVQDDAEAGVMGIFMVEFVVGTDGMLSNFDVVSSVGPQVDKEIVRVLGNSPKWKPAKKDGSIMAQKVSFNLMISFSYEEE